LVALDVLLEVLADRLRCNSRGEDFDGQDMLGCVGDTKATERFGNLEHHKLKNVMCYNNIRTLLFGEKEKTISEWTL